MDGTNFQKKDFNGANGKYPKGDRVIVPVRPDSSKESSGCSCELNPINSL
jgi:hypothetical protein